MLPVQVQIPLEESPPSAGGGAAALAVLEAALDRVRGGERRALVTAPLSKAAVTASGVPFSGHTGWLAERLGVQRVVMLFIAGAQRVALATVHVPLKEVSSSLSLEGLVNTLEILDSWLRTHAGLDSPDLAVLGLNPHAGEDGLLGTEEREVIAPGIDAFNRRGGRASGPHSADSFFRTPVAQEADAVLAMYHDQGLIPMKAPGLPPAVNVTLGLPLVRTSVDHGCAFSLAGQGNADPGSMVAALDCARGLLG
jgi:4-hydroxythreonine-4-phosphate dehydrogenase